MARLFGQTNPWLCTPTQVNEQDCCHWCMCYSFARKLNCVPLIQVSCDSSFESVNEGYQQVFEFVSVRVIRFSSYCWFIWSLHYWTTPIHICIFNCNPRWCKACCFLDQPNCSVCNSLSEASYILTTLGFISRFFHRKIKEQGFKINGDLINNSFRNEYL